MKQIQLTILILSFSITVLAQDFSIQSQTEIINQKSYLFNAQKLATRITKKLNSDEEKVSAIFNWITGNITYDVKRFKESSIKMLSTSKTLKKRKALCLEYAILFNEMAASCGITSFVITGYCKGFEFEKDDSLYFNDHAWNMVYVNNKWQLIDVTFGSGYLKYVPSIQERVKALFRQPLTKSKIVFIKERNSRYFLTNPCLFLMDHLASVPFFNLVDFKVSIDSFKNAKEFIYCNNAKISEMQSNNSTMLFWQNTSLKERYRWFGDSAYLYNNGNILEQCIDFNHSGFEEIAQTGKILAKTKGYFSNNLTVLENAKLSFDSSSKLVPLATQSIKAEASGSRSHNILKSKMAYKTITKHSILMQKYFSTIKFVPIINRRAVYKIKIQNRLIKKEINKTGKKNLNATLGNIQLSETERLNYLGYNTENIKIALDSIEATRKEVDSIYRHINDTLISNLLYNQNNLSKIIAQIYEYTAYCTHLRFEHFDQLDDCMIDLIVKRNLFQDTFNLLRIERKGLKASLRIEQVEMRRAIQLIKKTISESKAFMKSNTNLGQNENETFDNAIMVLVNQLELLYLKNKQVMSYLQIEKKWAIQEKEFVIQLKNLLDVEHFYELHRFKIRNKFIQTRKLKNQKLLKFIKRNNELNISSIKRMIKKVNE